MFYLVSERDEKFQIFSDGIASVGLEILTKTFIQFPTFIITFDFNVTTAVLFVERFDLLSKENRVK